MQKVIKVVIAIFFVMLIVQSVQTYFAKKQNKIPNMVSAVNASLPKKVDEVTTFTKLELDGKTLRFHYALIPGETVDPEGLAEIKAQAVKGICTSEAKMVFEEGISIEFAYFFQSKDGGDKKVSFSVPPDSCKKEI